MPISELVYSAFSVDFILQFLFFIASQQDFLCIEVLFDVLAILQPEELAHDVPE
jgi:hypothetical protein